MKFKRLYHGMVYGREEIENQKLKDLDISFETQSLFDFIFDELIKNDNSNTPIPFWAMDIYNSFVRTIEDKNLSLVEKSEKILAIRLELIEEASKCIERSTIESFIHQLKAA